MEYEDGVEIIFERNMMENVSFLQIIEKWYKSTSEINDNLFEIYNRKI